MQTIKIKYTMSEDDRLLLNEYIRLYNYVYRVAFNKFLEVHKFKYTELLSLNHIEKLDSWFVLSASYEAKFLYSNVGDNAKVIFGGKKNFFNRMKGLISKDEYNERRIYPLTSYGEKKSGTKSVHGNRKFKLSEDLSCVYLKLKDQKILINLPKLHLNIKKQLAEVYKHQILDDCPITYKIDHNYVYILFDEELVLKNKQKSKFINNRVLGIDLNPNYIGWSIVDWKSEAEFKVIKSGIYSIKELNDKDFKLKGLKLSSDSKERIYISNKRRYETILIIKNLINKAIYYKCQLVSIEDLNIKSSDKELGRHFNKLVNNSWNRTLFENNILKRCNIFGIKLMKVKPEYSSFIGNFLYRSLNLPDMCLSSIELSRRAYEFYNQYISKTKEIKKNIVRPNLTMFNKLYIKSLEEFNLQPTFKDLIELYYFFKKSKMMYRLSIDLFNLLFSRLFSNKSYVGLFIYKKNNLL